MSVGAQDCSNANATANENVINASHHHRHHNRHYAQLFSLAERAAGAFGCDLDQLLRTATSHPPKVDDANVACSPGGRRSSRAIEENTAKTRNALAKALADVLLAYLWRAPEEVQGQQQQGDGPHADCGGQTADDASTSGDSAPCSPRTNYPMKHTDPCRHVGKPWIPSLGIAKPTSALLSSDGGYASDDDAAPQHRRGPPSSRRAGSGAKKPHFSPQQHPTQEEPVVSLEHRLPVFTPSDRSPAVAKPALWLPPQQHPPSEDRLPPQHHQPSHVPQQKASAPQSTATDAAKPPLPLHLTSNAIRQSPAARPTESPEGNALRASFLFDLSSSAAGGGGGNLLRHSASSGLLGLSGCEGGRSLKGIQHQQQQQFLRRASASTSFVSQRFPPPARTPATNDDFARSAFESAADLSGFGGAFVPQTIPVATFLQKVESAAALSATTGGVVSLDGLPIEFTATRKASQARAASSNHWVLNGRYEFIRRLGAGGQGTVWQVADLTSGEQLAIKIVPRGKMTARKFGVAVACEGAGFGLLAGDVSAKASLMSAATATADDAARTNNDDDDADEGGDKNDGGNATAEHGPPPPLLLRQGTNSWGGGSDSRRSCPSTVGALGQSANPAPPPPSSTDGQGLLAQSVDVLRSFYEGGSGGALPESLAMEIVMGLFRHPNTVPLYEVIDDASCNNVFLVMPLARPLPFSLNLASGCLTSDRSLPPAHTILSYAKGAAAALSAFHAAGIVHCDIKLENLLLLPQPHAEANLSGGRDATDDDEDVLAVGDFGVCQLFATGSQQAGRQLSLLGGGSGTLAYWAPECFAAKKQSDTFTAASDCYALGLCLFALAFGRFPYWSPDVTNALSWEKVIPGTARCDKEASVVEMPPPPVEDDTNNSGRNLLLLRTIIQGLLAPAAQQRMSALTVLELTQ